MDTIQLHLLENRGIQAKVKGYPYSYEGGFNIVAGEEDATEFEIASIPQKYSDFIISLQMTNALKEAVAPPPISNNKFALPIGMAVAGYGQIVITAQKGKEKVVFLPLKIKVANTDLNWQSGVINVIPLEIGDTITLPAGSPAKVINRGTAARPILDFEIPQGPQGVGGAGSNPNLLINPDFKINQRGAEEYNSNGKYTVDRWLLRKNGDGYFNVSTKILSSGSTGTYAIMEQKFENGARLVDNNVTLRLRKKVIKGNCYIEIGYYSGTTFVVIRTVSTSAIDVSFTFLTLTTQIPTALVGGGSLAVRVYTQAGGEVALDWAKLEIGSVATAYTPPNIAEELLKCMRFYWRIENNSGDRHIAIGLSNGTNGYFPLQLGVPLRTKAPTISYDNINIYNGVAGGAIPITNLAVHNAVQNSDSTETIVTLRADFSGEAQHAYTLRLTANSFLALDAEL